MYNSYINLTKVYISQEDKEIYASYKNSGDYCILCRYKEIVKLFFSKLISVYNIYSKKFNQSTKLNKKIFNNLCKYNLVYYGIIFSNLKKILILMKKK